MKKVILLSLLVACVVCIWIAARAQTSPLVAQGKAYLDAHNILAARDTFQQAVAANSADQEAQFYYAVTRVAAVYEDAQSVSGSALYSVREALELSGVSFISFGLYTTQTNPMPTDLPSTTPRTGAAQDFLKAKLLPEIDGAIANINNVTNTSFSSVLDQSAVDKTGVSLNVDYGDVQVVKAALYAAEAALELLLAYDLDVNLPPLANGDMNDLIRFRNMILNNPTVLTPKEAARLATAESDISSSIDTFNAAVTAIKARTIPAGHAFVLDQPITNQVGGSTTAQITDFQSTLSDVKASLSGPRVFSGLKDTPDPQRTFDLSKLFNAASPLNIRSLVSDANGDFAQNDVTWGGIAPYGGLELFQDSIYLGPGWTLISLPVIPADLSIATVLAPIAGKYLGVWGYDQTANWRIYRPNAAGNTLTAFEAGKGYWIYATDFTVLNLQGASAPRSVPLTPGWNLVGYSDVLGYYQAGDIAISRTPGVLMLWGYRRGAWGGYSPLFNVNVAYPTPNLTQSRAYWILAAGNSTLNPPPLDPNAAGGYEVYGSTRYSPASADAVIKNPVQFGFTLVGRSLTSDSDYTAKQFNLSNQYNYFVVKTANPLGGPVKIDGLSINGQCLSFYGTGGLSSLYTNNADPSLYLWRLASSGPCADGYYATITENGGILASTASSISTITVYGVR